MMFVKTLRSGTFALAALFAVNVSLLAGDDDTHRLDVKKSGDGPNITLGGVGVFSHEGRANPDDEKTEEVFFGYARGYARGAAGLGYCFPRFAPFRAGYYAGSGGYGYRSGYGRGAYYGGGYASSYSYGAAHATLYAAPDYYYSPPAAAYYARNSDLPTFPSTWDMPARQAMPSADEGSSRVVKLDNGVKVAYPAYGDGRKKSPTDELRTVRQSND